MPTVISRHRIDQGRSRAEGGFMRFVRLLGERLARPRFLHAGELSPHLLRDIGLVDDRMAGRRPRP